jgi:O-antigen ligase
MTSASVEPARPARDRLGAWCGWVLIGAAVLIPLLGWLGPQGFAVLTALMGLLLLPAIRMTDEDRPALMVLLGLVIWAAASTSWSPYHPKNTSQSTILKLALALPLCWAAICGARRADPRLRGWALRVLAWGLAAFGVILLIEAATSAALYRAIHIAFYEPIRIDLAWKNVAQSTFVLALLWPVLAFAPGLKAWERWLALPMAAGTVVAAKTFAADAPVLGLPLTILVALAVRVWPRTTPKVLATGTAALVMVMPAIVWVVRRSGDYGVLEHDIPESWSMRMSYWSHAIDWIRLRPLQGWGLDASRMFGPGIVLHPHNDELQVWMELGAVGAVAVAVFWWLSLSRLSRPAGDRSMMGVAAASMVYLLFASLNFGAWQEWWVELGVLIPVLSALAAAPPSAQSST